MNEKIQKCLDSVYAAADKAQVMPKIVDDAVNTLKKPAVACIPAIINKIACKFGTITIALMAVIYAIYCLKNTIISLVFKSGPTALSIAFALISLIAAFISSYIVYKMAGMFDRIISTSPCRISSKNIFSVFALFSALFAIAALVGGIYLAIEFESFVLSMYGLAVAILFFLIALYNSTTDDFAITEDVDASAGEDFIAICSFGVKVILRLIPIAVLVLSIIGICACIPEIFESYTVSEGNESRLMVGSMLNSMCLLAFYLFVGLIPLVAYFYYLASYISLDIIRAVLSLPKKLDLLNK